MQPYVTTRNIRAVLAADALADGTVQVSAADAANLWPGAQAILVSSAVAAVEVLILEDLGSNKFRVRKNDSTLIVPSKVPAGGSDLSAYHTADAAYLLQAGGQAIHPYPRDGVIPRTPSALK